MPLKRNQAERIGMCYTVQKDMYKFKFLKLRNRNLKRRNNAMNFFENTRKPQGFGGKLMTKMMNIGHAKLSQWGLLYLIRMEMW